MLKDRLILAKGARFSLAGLSADTKNKALKDITKALEENKTSIFEKNQADMDRSESEGLAPALLKRLKFDQSKLNSVIEGLSVLSELDDPNRKILDAKILDDGLTLYKVSAPIGVIAMIFESRPDALVQISSLALKSGNCVVLKGGREALETNKILSEIIDTTGQKAGLPQGWLTLIETREEVSELLSYDQYIDLIIPRGSNEFVKYIMDNSDIPVMGHADGICHSYVHSDADLKKAVPILVDAKTQYVAVCNAMETLLVHSSVANTLLPEIKKEMDERKTIIKGDSRVQEIIDVDSAEEKDWGTEYLDYILSIKIVDSLDEAIDHINRYGSSHTDVILAKSPEVIEKFMQEVDSASVMANCSSRFADGFRFGLGAEVGISTGKLHARGPVGMEGLMSFKWRLYGDGQIVEDYSNGTKSFQFTPIEDPKLP